MLTGPQIRQIQAALLSAFPSKDALAMMTRLELEQNLEAIAGGENLSVVIFKLVSWAETHHRIPDLIQGATRHNPGNAALQQLAREAATWVTVTPPAEITGTQPLIQAADPPTAIDIFLSYSRLDSALMRRLYADLRGAGFSVWIDEGLEPGTPSWQRAVEEAIETAKCVVVILSPDAKQSKWVEIEVSYAEEIGLRIFPVLARGDERNAVLFRLRTTQRVDIRRQYEKVTVELLPTLQRRLRFDVAAPAPAASPIDFDWVTIPAGEFLMGSDKQRDKQALDRELPQHTRYLPEYRIARAPVTVAQFTAFVEATGYKTTAEVKGSAYVWTGTQWEEVKGADWAHPRGPASNVLQKQTHPVTVVSWHDALVFCRWAGVRLPSEMEWEKAARGVDGRIWPWGIKRRPATIATSTGMWVTHPRWAATPTGPAPMGCWTWRAMSGSGAARRGWRTMRITPHRPMTTWRAMLLVWCVVGRGPLRYPRALCGPRQGPPAQPERQLGFSGCVPRPLSALSSVITLISDRQSSAPPSGSTAARGVWGAVPPSAYAGVGAHASPVA